MNDQYGRKIDYIRISVTDRCNLRCGYCMPEEGVEWLPHDAILSYEELLQICRALARLGVKKVKLTGGEPLVRKNMERLIFELKEIEGITSVTLTTNGILLAEQLPQLVQAGLDGVNISLDTLNASQFFEITRRTGLDKVLAALDAALAVPGLNVKLNCVPTAENANQWAPIAALAKESPLSVRFIEMMPIGLGQRFTPCAEEEVRRCLEEAFGVMSPYEGVLGNGPSHYFSLADFQGKIGFISAISHKFCSECNRVRLTATGFLKTCLQYETGQELRPALSEGEDVLMRLIEKAVFEKPISHCFERAEIEQGEQHMMSQIGG